MPTAAIIIAARDAAAWLPQCLESVGRQSVPSGWRTRILLGVDACRSTLAAANSLAIPNLTVHFFPDHVGPYIIFNTLSYSDSADVLVRFDADDMMLEGYLESQLSLLDRQLSPAIIQTWSIYVDPQLKPISASLANGSSTYRDGRRPGTSDGQFLFTRSVWNRLGAFQPWWCHGDTEFIRRAKYSGTPHRVVRKYLYLRRVHATSLTQSNTTGYRSQVREFYARHIAQAGARYACGIPPERVYPAMASFFRVAV